MELAHILVHGFVYAFIGNGYLFLAMFFLDPRIWGINDYPDVIKAKVPPQTSRERIIALVVFLPWFLFIFLFPLYSTLLLKTNLGNEISYLLAFLNITVSVFLFYLGDLIILDWLIISKITPSFVIISGSALADYKDFSHHYKAQAKAILPILLLCLIFAGVVVVL